MRALLLSLLLLAPVLHAEERQAVIFMYHHFGDERYPSTNVTLAQFEAHLDYIAEAGYQVWPLEKVVEYLRANKPFPTRVVALTIDDAYTSVYSEAYPRLRARGWPFTVFVATDGVDRKYTALMNWEQMREMQAHGASFANHTSSHDYLLRRKPGETQAEWLARLRADILHAQSRLQQELGAAPKLFAFPYGEYNTAVANLLAELGFVSFGQQSGPVGLTSDLRALPRFPMAEKFAAIADFRTKIASLALPVTSIEPWDPVVTDNNPPRLTLGLGDNTARLNQLLCYVSGQGRVTVEWLDKPPRHFAVQAPQPLPLGRSRYNCTAPSNEQGRFYWFSQPWVRMAEDDS